MTSFKDVHHKCVNCGFLVAVVSFSFTFLFLFLFFSRRGFWVKSYIGECGEVRM